MSKQEEIREGFEKFICGWFLDYEKIIDLTPQASKAFLTYLHEHDCVLKVDRELPIEVKCESGVFEYLHEDEVDRFPAVEPLIKEEK